MTGSITALVETLVANGATPEMILAMVRTAEAQKDDALERSREKARNRIKKWRDKQPRNVTERPVIDTKPLAGAEGSSSTKEITGQEEKKERTPAAPPKRAARLPADWVLPEDWFQDALDAGLPAIRIRIEAEKMKNWSLSAKNGAKLEWRAVWRNWVQTAIENLSKATGPPAQRTMNDVLDEIISGKPANVPHPGPTVDASFSRTDRSSATNLVQLNAAASGRRP